MALTQLSPSTVLAEKIARANELGLRIKAAKSDKTAMVREILTSSDDEKIVKIRAEIEKMKARIAQAEELAKEHALTLVPGVDEDFDVEEATQEFLRLRRECVAARSALETLIDPETLASELESLGVAELVNLRGTGNRKGSNTGVKRPRISAATVDGEAVWTDPQAKKVNFSTLANVAEVDANELKAAAIKAAESENLNDLPAGTVVKFTMADKDFTVTVSGSKPGRKATEKSE